MSSKAEFQSPVPARLTPETASFRDRRARVYYHHGQVFRCLDASGQQAWNWLEQRPVFRRWLSARKVVGTESVPLQEIPLQAEDGEWCLALKHDRIPVISYPYEWPFSMLKDAATFHLDLLLEGLDDEVSLRDATPYNIQWLGCQPTFIDIPSFDRLNPQEPWVGYRQFCQLFLNPLMLQAYKGVPFQPWLRGSIDGILPEHCARLFSWTDVFKPGVAGHLWIHSALESRHQGKAVKQEISDAGFGKEILKAMWTKLRRLVGGLTWKESQSTWADYTRQHSYSDDDFRSKEAFVDEVCKKLKPSSVWDVGANTGHFSRIAAEHADYVVALEADYLAADRLYRLEKERAGKNVLPLCMNFSDPSPALGWRSQERVPLGQRSQPDLVMCLAVIHHLVIGANLLLDDLIQLLSETTAHLIIEYVDRADPMVQKLLSQREDVFRDYQLERFEAALTRHFNVQSSQVSGSGTRILYYACQR